MSDKMLWEVGKEYLTNVGFRARIYAVDGKGFYSIHGAIWLSNDIGWRPSRWAQTGECDGYDSNCNLLPPAKPRIKGECWLAIHKNGYVSGPYAKGQTINGFAMLHVPYDVEEGEGL